MPQAGDCLRGGVVTFDEWYDDPATLGEMPTDLLRLQNCRLIARAAYEAGARSRDEEVERLRKGLATAGARPPPPPVPTAPPGERRR